MHSNAESLLLLVLLQLTVIIAAARVGGALFRRMGQPQVCGEIAAGLLLGPSLFGGLFPQVFHAVFNPAVEQTFRNMSQIGLILLLFLIGIEFDFTHLRNPSRSRSAVAISIVGVAIPFVFGLGIARILHPVVAPGASRLGFAMFMGVALSITALPILGRIMIEYRLNRTPLGAITITAAAIDDAVGWTLLALVSSLVRAGSGYGRALLMAAETMAYGLFLVVVARPLLKRWARAAVRRGGGQLGMGDMTILFSLIMVSSMVTNLIGIFAIFGAFMVGTVLFDEEAFREAVVAKLGDFVTVFFLPIFFTYTGLRTDIGAMHGTALWVLSALVVAAGVVGKLGGCTVAARASGLSWHDATTIGIMMNTRALMALIVINVGFELGVIPKSVFFMLVLMAVVTTYMTAPLLKRQLRRSPAESLVHPRGPASEPLLAPTGS